MTKKVQLTTLPSIDRLLPMTKVMDLTSFSKATVYRKIADGSFPAPRKIGKSRVAWLEADIAGWIRSQPTSASCEQSGAAQAA